MWLKYEQVFNDAVEDNTPLQKVSNCKFAFCQDAERNYNSPFLFLSQNVACITLLQDILITSAGVNIKAL